MSNTKTTKETSTKEFRAISPLELAKQQRIEKILSTLFDKVDSKAVGANLKKLVTVYKYTSGASDEVIEDMEWLVGVIQGSIENLETLKTEFEVLTQLH